MDEKIPGLNEVVVPARRMEPGEREAAGMDAPASGAAPLAAAPPRAGSGFDFNRPTIVAGLYLAGLAVGFTGIVGVVLAYVWRNEEPHGWEASHYTYLIRGFWLWFFGCLLGMLLLVVFIGLFILMAAFGLIVARAIMSIIRAQNREPMPNPEAWLV